MQFYPKVLALAGYFITHPFVWELSEATSCDSIMMVDFEASGRRVQKTFMSSVARNGAPFRITSNALLMYRNSGVTRRLPCNKSLVTNLGSDMKPST